MAQTRFYEEFQRNSSALGRLSSVRQEELEESQDIFNAEEEASFALCKERAHLVYAAYASQVTGLTSALAYCLAAASAAVPLTPGAYLRCSGICAAGMAAATNVMKKEVDAAWEVKRKDNELARHRKEDRDDVINALYDKWVANENALNLSNLALIEEDLRLCLERVNN